MEKVQFLEVAQITSKRSKINAIWTFFKGAYSVKKKSLILASHSLIRGVLIQSCSARAKKFTNYVFCHPQFSDVIQNIGNFCAISAKFWKFDFWLYKIDYFDNNRHRQTGVKMAQRFSIFWITPLNCGWQNT